MAQTTRLASFGPILVATALISPLSPFETSIQPKYKSLVRIFERIKDKLTYCPNKPSVLLKH
jgi:hypothetical protein